MRIVQNNSGFWCERKTTQFRLENENSEPQMWDKQSKSGVYLGVKTCEVFLCFVSIMFVLSIVWTSLFSLFYVTREGERFLHRE